MLCSDNELKEKIIKEIPNDSFENKEKLINNIRIWCYENIPVFEINKLQDTIVLEDGTREYKPVWITKKLYEIYNDFKNRGFWCSGHSMFLSKIYGMFGFKSDVIAY